MSSLDHNGARRPEGASGPSRGPDAADNRRRANEGHTSRIPAEFQDQIDQAVEAVDNAIEDRAAAQRKITITELQRVEVFQDPDATELAKAIAEDRHRTAIAKYEAANRKVARLQRSLDRLHDSAPILAQADAGGSDADDEASVLAFPNADAWVRGWLLQTWRRADARWCEKWWLHAEALSRIEAIWRAWEHLRNDGALGPSIWWRDHGDYHLAILTAPNGPFRLCQHDKHVHKQMPMLPAKVRHTAADPEPHIRNRPHWDQPAANPRANDLVKNLL